MSFSIFDHGDGRFRLVRDEREVGWIEGNTIGFRGFADIDEARTAASTAYAAIAAWIARQLRTEPVPPRRRRLTVRRDGAIEWLTLGGSRIGRLRRFGADDLPGHAPDVGFEVYLPPRLGGGLALGAAQLVDRALRSGVSAGVSAPATAAPNGAPTAPLATAGHAALDA